MRKKHKHKQHFNIRPELAGAMYVIGLAGLLVQSHANLSVHPKKYEPIVAVTLLGPAPKPTAAPAPAPSPTPAPTTTPVKPQVAYKAPPKYVPPVTPVPDSNVQHLVAVAQPPSGSTGLGSGTGGSSPTPSPAPSGTPQPAAYTYQSYNWAGYLSTGGKFSGVRGSWLVPAVSGNGLSTTADAAWIGIGGVTSADLIQVGTTESVSRSGHLSYGAFYEMLPAPETPVANMTIAAGDVMSADISEQSPGTWVISLTDTTRSESFSITVQYSSTYSTAEWIEEDPSFSSGGLVPFDNFGFIDFSGGTTTENGTSKSIYSSSGQAVLMVNSSNRSVATPSVLTSDGQGFRVTAG